MFRSANDAAQEAAHRAREEMGEAWTHLLAAAEQGARQAGETTRRQGALARERAAAAAMALRGEQPPSPWRWLAVGLAAGIAVGSAGAVILSRRMQGMDTDTMKERAGAAMDSMRERTGGAVEAVRQRTSEAANTAVSTARDTAGKVTGRSGAPSPTPDEAVSGTAQPGQPTG
jgi:hypothetical protein